MNATYYTRHGDAVQVAYLPPTDYLAQLAADAGRWSYCWRWAK